MKKTDTKRLVGMALFTAIVVVLQLLGQIIRFGPFSISLVLVPIVIGAALYGVGAGAWLGAVFGVVVLFTDASAFLAVSIPGTVVTVLVKGIAAGAGAALVYKLLEKKNQYLAVMAAAVACPVLNTGLFLVGCLVFFFDTVAGWASAVGFEGSVGTYMIVGLVGLNFVIELAVDVVLAPVIIRLIKIGKKA